MTKQLLDEAVENLARAALSAPDVFDADHRTLADAICGVRDRTSVLLSVVREIDVYAGAAADVTPAVGVVAVPLRHLASLRRALEDLGLR